MSWRLAPSLDAARAEANAIAPRRSKVSDGTIGDAAHAASRSDHNPTAEGWVNALDLTHDPAGGFDAHAWADAISRRNDPRVKYLISRGRIWNPTIGDKPGAWRRYTGSNPHNSHLHISVRDTPTARNDRSPWFGSAAPQPTPAPVAAPTAQPTIEEDAVRLVRNDIAGDPGRGQVWALWSDRTRTPVSADHYPHLKAYAEASGGSHTNIGNAPAWSVLMQTWRAA